MDDEFCLDDMPAGQDCQDHDRPGENAQRYDQFWQEHAPPFDL
jgi:hypothetical protein